MANIPVEAGTSHNTSATTSTTTTLTQSIASGDLIIAHGIVNANATITMTDSQSGTWTTIFNSTFNASGQREVLAYCVAAASYASGVDNVRAGTTGSNLKALQVWTLTGYTATPLDKTQQSGNQASTTTPTTGTTLTTTQADEIAIASYAYVSNPAFTPAAGYSQTATTQISTNANEISGSLTYKVLSATGTQVAVAGLSPTEPAAGIIATFMAAAASAPFAPATVHLQAVNRAANF